MLMIQAHFCSYAPVLGRSHRFTTTCQTDGLDFISGNFPHKILQYTHIFLGG